MHIDMQEIQAFFFEAMLQGWVNPDSHSEPITGMPGYKGFRYRKDRLYLRDAFIANLETGKSAGSTTILQDDVPVWVMHYGGIYSKKTAPFVQLALRDAYTLRTFKGGRGTDKGSNEGEWMLLYQNLPTCNDFCNFRGRETVAQYDRHEWVITHYHDYWGMSLV